MKREVRQRCGFGCVLCGVPIFDYEHMVEFATTQVHEVENLTLLCPNHHREKSSGRLPVSEVQDANRNPFCKQQNHTTPYFMRAGSPAGEVVMLIGRNWFANPSQVIPIVIDEQPLVGLRRDQDGKCVLDLLLLNRYNEVTLLISGGEVVLSAEAWDFTLEGRTLAVRSALGVIVLELVLNDDDVELTRGHFLYNGVEVSYNKNGLKFGDSEVGAHFQGNLFNEPVAYALGRSDNYPSVNVRMRQIDRYKHN